MFLLNSVIKIVAIKKVRICNQNVPSFPTKYIQRDQDATTGCYHRMLPQRQQQTSDRIFKMSPIHASIIYEITLICCIHGISVSFRENPNDAMFHTFRSKL